MNTLLMPANPHFLITHCSLVLALKRLKFIFKFRDSVIDFLIYRMCLVLQLLVNFVQPDRFCVHINKFVLCCLHAVIQSRLIYEGESNVADLLHGEHAWLSEPILIHIVHVTLIFALKFI